MLTVTENFWINKLAQQLRKHVHQTGETRLLQNIGVFHCMHPQALRSVPLHQPGFVLVVTGTKRVDDGNREILYPPGHLLLFPAGANLHTGNIPAPDSDYLAVAVTFAPDLLEHFVAAYGSKLELWSQLPIKLAKAPEALLHSLSQWVDACAHKNQSPLLHNHRAQELLLLLAQHQLAGNIFTRQGPEWSQKICAYFALDISRDWRMEEVAAYFGCSAATLRRKLDAENASFRNLLEEVRLSHGLGMLQESNWTITRVAQAVGYDSASRFSERFSLRFGLTPTELRLTRQAVQLESVK